ncbi:MAG TPA: response regulator [Gemmatimonadales bacterium]|nr:response regulator [Gemmatimonadales bacterium]
MQGRILIVDDDRDFVESLRVLLEGADYEVRVAYDGREGLALARRERPDLILVDVMMDERTEGFFTVQQLRRAPETAATPVFVVSAVYARVPELQVPPDPRWTGHDLFIAKPVDGEALLRQVRETLAGRVPERKGATP